MGINNPVTPEDIGAVPTARQLNAGSNITINGGPAATLANNVTIAASGGGGGDLGLIHIQDQKPFGSDGGNATTTWTLRDLNTVISNTIAGASLDTNSIILPAGTYDVCIFVPFFHSSGFGTKARLFNSTDASILLMSNTDWGSSSASGLLAIIGRIVLAAEKTLQVQQIGTTTQSGGWGANANITGEGNIFTNALFRKVA